MPTRLELCPETYAMMLAGIGLVFGIARRRRQVRA